jgi:hypothetical protein
MILYKNDPEGEHCRNCKKLYHEVYTVPGRLWKQVTGWKNGEGLLCMDCFTKLALEKNISIFWIGHRG